MNTLRTRFTPYTKFEKCKICKQFVHQAGNHYCQSKARAKGLNKSQISIYILYHRLCIQEGHLCNVWQADHRCEGLQTDKCIAEDCMCMLCMYL